MKCEPPCRGPCLQALAQSICIGSLSSSVTHLTQVTAEHQILLNSLLQCSHTLTDHSIHYSHSRCTSASLMQSLKLGCANFASNNATSQIVGEKMICTLSSLMHTPTFRCSGFANLVSSLAGMTSCFASCADRSANIVTNGFCCLTTLASFVFKQLLVAPVDLILGYLSTPALVHNFRFSPSLSEAIWPNQSDLVQGNLDNLFNEEVPNMVPDI